jgi:hypothetical protein
MIHHLFVDWLQEGELPLYDLWPGRSRRWYQILGGCWSIMLSRKLLISTDIDISYRCVEKMCRDWLADLLPGMADEDGSLVMTIRSSYRLTEGHHFVLFGLAFLPNITIGLPLEGSDPVPLLAQACDIGLAAQDAHPIIRQAMADNPHHYVKEAEAVQKARTLLLECLSEEQRAEFEARCQFHLTGGDGRTYLIKKGRGHNVYRIEGGRPVVEYCLITKEIVPDYDLMLAQKLLLEAAPGQFEATSNITILNRPLNFPQPHS